MKADIQRILNVPEKEELNIFEELLKNPVKKSTTVVALEARDNRALAARIKALEEQVAKITLSMEVKQQAEAQAKTFASKMPERHGHPWSASESRSLQNSWEQSNRSIADLAKYHERSERAIKLQLESLGYEWEYNRNIEAPVFDEDRPYEMTVTQELSRTRRRHRTC